MNEPKSNKVGINDTNELDEEKIVANTLHLHYRPSGIEAQQTKKHQSSPPWGILVGGSRL
jgi:hypothetical protein